MRFAEIAEIVAPPACVACRDPLPRAGPALCPACARAMPWLRAACPRCALPRHAGGRCPAAGAAFSRAWAAAAYGGPAARLVHALKIGGLLSVADVMAAQIAAGLPREMRAPDAVVPVPAQPGRRRRRGFDPAELIARGVAERLGVEITRPLRRVDRDRARRTLAGRERRRRAPLVDADGPVPARVLLVDDVHTTGATLGVCARALRDAGAGRVTAATYARALEADGSAPGSFGAGRIGA